MAVLAPAKTAWNSHPEDADSGSKPVARPIIKVFQVILIGVLIHGGYTWQALDHEAFPDESLPHWFVQLFR
jgi:hypothetical protein